MGEPHHAPAKLRPNDGIGRRAMLRSLAGTIGAGLAFPFFAEGHSMQHHLSDQEIGAETHCFHDVDLDTP